MEFCYAIVSSVLESCIVARLAGTVYYGSYCLTVRYRKVKYRTVKSEPSSDKYEYKLYSLCPKKMTPLDTSIRKKSGILSKRHIILVELNESY
jgi:hypothetical protein